MNSREKGKTLAIDPGNEQSAYVLLDNYKPVKFGIIENNELNQIISQTTCNHFAIEMVASYGMPVGESVFETCLWIGRFIETAHESLIQNIEKIYRKDVKMNLCHSMKAKDSNIRQALIDRFGEVGTKKNPGWFYGFKSDIWSAYAIGVTYLDSLRGNNDGM